MVVLSGDAGGTSGMTSSDRESTTDADPDGGFRGDAGLVSGSSAGAAGTPMRAMNLR